MAEEDRLFTRITIILIGTVALADLLVAVLQLGLIIF